MEIPIHRLKVIIPARPPPTSSTPEPEACLTDTDLALLCALSTVHEEEPEPGDRLQDPCLLDPINQNDKPGRKEC